jgi:hypothetical protein
MGDASRDDTREEIEADLHAIQVKLQRLHHELRARQRVDAPEPIDGGDALSMNPLTPPDSADD